MKVNRLLMVMMIALLSCLFFVSAPILADGGDEDPWDADGGNNGGSTGTGGDHSGGEGYLLLAFDNPTVPGQNSFMGFMFTISYDVANYFFGSQPDGSVPLMSSGREMKRDVTLTRQQNVSQAR